MPQENQRAIEVSKDDIDQRDDIVADVFDNPDLAHMSKEDILKLYEGWNDYYEQVSWIL